MEFLSSSSLSLKNGTQKLRNTTGDYEVAASMDPVWKLWFWQSLWKLCRVWAHLVGEAGEHIYGGGEQYTYLDLKVKRHNNASPCNLENSPLIGSELSDLGEGAGGGKEQEQWGNSSPIRIAPGFSFQKMTINLQVTQIMDMLYGGGGDYHTSYWPQPSYLSSRKYYIESTFQCERGENHWLGLNWLF